MERRTSSSDRRAATRGGRRHADCAGRPVVLIVDDHADSRELLVAILRVADVGIAEAATGEEALRRAAASPLPSLVLIDLTLPDCHGTDVVAALKAADATRDIPVVALSAAVRAVDKDAAARAGCADFVEKPVLPDAVLALVKRILSAAPAPSA